MAANSYREQMLRCIDGLELSLKERERLHAKIFEMDKNDFLHIQALVKEAVEVHEVKQLRGTARWKKRYAFAKKKMQEKYHISPKEAGALIIGATITSKVGDAIAAYGAARMNPKLITTGGALHAGSYFTLPTYIAAKNIALRTREKMRKRRQPRG
ncbi:MAG: hypothetical protein V1847_03645 [Candidatus Diapherotrites archaeon]